MLNIVDISNSCIKDRKGNSAPFLCAFMELFQN